MMPLFIRMPEPGSTVRLPMEESRVVVIETIVPSASQTVRWVVQLFGGERGIAQTGQGSASSWGAGAGVEPHGRCSSEGAAGRRGCPWRRAASW